jgi:hypothetical protein
MTKSLYRGQGPTSQVSRIHRPSKAAKGHLYGSRSSNKGSRCQKSVPEITGFLVLSFLCHNISDLSISVLHCYTYPYQEQIHVRFRTIQLGASEQYPGTAELRRFTLMSAYNLFISFDFSKVKEQHSRLTSKVITPHIAQTPFL